MERAALHDSNGDGETHADDCRACAGHPTEEGQRKVALPMLQDKCTKCGVTFGRAMLFALVRDMSGSAPDPLRCHHDFQPAPQEVA